MASDLTIRSARASDRPAMERICAHTFDWGGYIPEVWDDWLADRQGIVIVGEVGEQMVALSRITLQAARQVWLSGMRVEPEHRRQGIGGLFLEYSLSHARDHGARVVQLGTSPGDKVIWIGADPGPLLTASFPASQGWPARSGCRRPGPAPKGSR